MNNLIWWDVRVEQRVSIWCATYNHEKYIKDALEGFLRQKTNFKYKVVVYDDASTDRTSQILREYQNDYPEIFHVYISDHNRWKEKTRRSFFYEYKKEKLNTQYVAYCDGDDYWLDENKLQLQVDYMDAHPECMMCIHNAVWMDFLDGTTKNGNPFDICGEKDIGLEELIEQKNGHPPTASFLFRRELLEKDFFFFDAPVGDYTLLLCAATNGTVHYNSKLMSVYRYRTPGSYSDSYQREDTFNSYYCLGLITFLIQYNKCTKGMYEKNIYHVIRRLESQLVQICFSRRVGIHTLYDSCIQNSYYLSSQCYKIIADESDEVLYKRKEKWIENLTSFAKQYSNIVIMGTGKYAQILTGVLENLGIEFLGYAVSTKSEDMLYYNEKPVWQLDQIPYRSQKIGVLVGIWIVDEEEIEKSIRNAGILNYSLVFRNSILEDNLFSKI